MPTGANNLGSQLGQMLFGQPDDNKAYYEGQAIGSLVNDRMASANANRVKALLGQDELQQRQAGITPEAAVAMGYPAAAAPFITAVLRSNDTVDLRNLGDFANPVKMQALSDAKQAAGLGDMTTANDNLAVFHGQPMETSRVTEGQVFNPYGDSHQAVPLTALGTAIVGEKQAGAADKYASAKAHNAEAALHDVQRAAGGFAPSHAATNPSTPPINALGALLGANLDASGHLIIPQGDMQHFLAWKAQKAQTDPRYNDGDYALAHYASEAPLGSGIHDTPVDVGANLVVPKLGDATVKNAPTPAAAPAAAKPVARKAPAIGTSEGGYIFKGGDPSDKANWVKASDLMGAAQ